MVKKVICINPANYGRENLRPPFGMLTIATIFDAKGVEVVWIDADVIQDHDKINKEINKYLDADLIATGGMHTSYIYIKELFEYLNKNKINIPTIIGGRIASTLSHLIWQFVPNVTMVCKQEGEKVVDSICNHFPNIEKIEGIEYKKNGSIIATPAAAPILSMDEIPPLKWEWLNHKYFIYPKNTAYLLTGRGCPFRCHFCRSIDAKPDKYRTMSVQQIIHEVEYMMNNNGIKNIVFVDELFLQNKERVAEISEKLKKYKIKWRCSCRGDTITKNDSHLLRIMRESGCESIVMGIESGSQKMLNLMNKKLRIEKVEQSIKQIRIAGMKIRPTFIFGYPGETRSTAIESVKWRLKMRFTGRFFYATPYPGSELYNIWKKKNTLTIDDEEHFILKSMSLKKQYINFTKMPDWKLKILAAECMLRLNMFSPKWLIKKILISPLRKMNRKIYNRFKA